MGLVSHGFEQDLQNRFLPLGMTEESKNFFQKPFYPVIERESQGCRARATLWTDQQWHASPLRRTMVDEFGLDDWLLCVRYHNQVTWSCITLFRAPDQPNFTSEDAMRLEIAFSAIPWLHEAGKDIEQYEEVHSLGERNSQVLHLLLEGRSRKEIAVLLDTTIHIVNDSVKQIFDHFGTSSVTELAAIFLRRV